MARQALSTGIAKGDANFVAKGTSRPIGMTRLAGPVMDNVKEGQYSGLVYHHVHLPGHPLWVSFVDRALNIEDPVSIRKGAALADLFEWSATMT